MLTQTASSRHVVSQYQPVSQFTPVHPTSQVQVSGAVQVPPFWQGLVQMAAQVVEHMSPVKETHSWPTFIIYIYPPSFIRYTCIHCIYIHIFMKDMHIYFTAAQHPKHWQCTHSNILYIGQDVDVDCYIWKYLTSYNRNGFVPQEQQDDERWLPHTKVHFATKLQRQSRISVIMRQQCRYL